MSAHLKSALDCAAYGWPVLPAWWCLDSELCACGDPPGECKPGKHPLGRLVHHGVKSATLDPPTVESWWRRYSTCSPRAAERRFGQADWRMLSQLLAPARIAASEGAA
jgi:hypothetical protein